MKQNYLIRRFFVVVMAFCILGVQGVAWESKDPLPSWNDGDTKRKIIKFVEEVTNPKSLNFVVQRERIAAFDLDGTLMTEWPVNLQRALGVKKLKERVSRDNSLKDVQPFKAAFEADHMYYNHKTNHSFVFLKAFEGETQANYEMFIKDFLKSEKDPHWRVGYNKLFYQPGIELVKYLEKNGFEVYICSTTEVACIRELLSQVLGMDPGKVIGNEVVKEFKFENGRSKFSLKDSFRTPENRSEHKSVYFTYRTGELPIFGFGNAMGDCALLQLVEGSNKPHFVMILDHDDPERELEYHDYGLLKAAHEHGWEIVSMKRDFKKVHPQKLNPVQEALNIEKYLN